MSIAKILVPVTGSKADICALLTAFAAAKMTGAHVEALFASPDPREAIPCSEVPISADVLNELIEDAERLACAASKAARENIALAASQAAVEIVACPRRSATATVSLREMVCHRSAAVAQEAVLSDLVAWPPLDAQIAIDDRDAFQWLLTNTGRPFLLSAKTPAKSFAGRIAVGWDGGISAAHALTAALPFLDGAKHVELLCVAPLRSKNRSVEDAKRYLSLHGIGCTDRVVEHGQRHVADVLLEAAAGCDLLVLGGYGHSRLRESIFGGVTASIVSQSLLPILMVH